MFASHLVDPVEGYWAATISLIQALGATATSLDSGERVIPAVIQALDYRSTLSVALAGYITGDECALNAYDGAGRVPDDAVRVGSQRPSAVCVPSTDDHDIRVTGQGCVAYHSRNLTST